MKKPIFIIYGTQEIPLCAITIYTKKPLVLFDGVGEILGLVNGQMVSEEVYKIALDANLSFGGALCAAKMNNQRIEE